MWFAIQASVNGYSQERMRGLFERVQERFSRLRCMRAVPMAEVPLVAGENEAGSLIVEGYHPKEDEDMTSFENYVGPGYFATMGIPILAGRDFAKSDGAGAPKVVIVNQTLAKYFFGDENPLGRRIRFRRDEVGKEIVGVVKDGKSSDLKEKPRRFVYGSDSQKPTKPVNFHSRTAPDPSSAFPSLLDHMRRG